MEEPYHDHIDFRKSLIRQLLEPGRRKFTYGWGAGVKGTFLVESMKGLPLHSPLSWYVRMGILPSDEERLTRKDRWRL